MNQESNAKSIHPSALPPAWVEKIFATMLAHYGSRFADMWRDTDIAMVKAVWAKKLAGFYDRTDCLKYGLDCLLGRDWPPTLPEFIQDCRRAPEPEFRALEHKLSPEELDRNKERARQMAEKLGRRMAA